MHTLKRNAIVPYSQRQMFELVNDISEYPRFLPWCHSSEILSETNEEVIAKLEINWNGIRKSFTTRNRLHSFGRMEMTLVDGPLKRLEGNWAFIPLNSEGCKITLDMEFEFTGAFIDRLFQPIFQHIATTFVDAFCKRAVEIYGTE